jgi:hypothetical protein
VDREVISDGTEEKQPNDVNGWQGVDIADCSLVKI